MARIANFTSSGVPASGVAPQTLDALMARAKELADRQGQIAAPRDMPSPWQGAAQLAQSFVNARQAAATDQTLADERGQFAKVMSGIDLEKGATPEQLSQIGLYSPDQADKVMAMTAAAIRARKDQEFTHSENEATRAATLAAEKLKLEASGGWKPTDIGSLRDDYTKAATTYDQAAPSWQSMQEAAKTALDPRTDVKGKGTADYNMIVAFAKLLDPNSVVREGEVKSASMTEGMLNQVQSMLNQWTSKGMLDDGTRRAIMAQSQSRVKAYYDQAKQKRDWVSSIATRHQVNPDDVVPPLAPFVPFEEAQPDPNQPPVPGTTPPAAVPGTTPPAAPPAATGTPIPNDLALIKPNVPYKLPNGKTGVWNGQGNSGDPKMWTVTPGGAPNAAP